MARGTLLTKEQKAELIRRHEAGERVRDLVKEIRTSIPNAYLIIRKAKQPVSPTAPPAEVSAVDALEREIDQTEKRITELKEKVAEIEALEKEVELKKSFLESLKKLKGQS